MARKCAICGKTPAVGRQHSHANNVRPRRIEPASGNFTAGDIKAETRRVLENIGALLKAGGLDYAAVVRSTVYLADMNDFAAMNEVYGAFFVEPYPARATVQVARLPRDARVEIDVIAAYEGR